MSAYQTLVEGPTVERALRTPAGGNPRHTAPTRAKIAHAQKPDPPPPSQKWNKQQNKPPKLSPIIPEKPAKHQHSTHPTHLKPLILAKS